MAGGTGIVTGELGQEGQRRVFVNVPGQAWGNVVALIVDVVDLGATVTDNATDAIEKATFIVDLAGAGEVDLAMVVAAVLKLDFVSAFRLRTAADHVQQAARWSLAVDRRGRAAQQGEAVEVPGFGFRVGIHPAWQRQPIEELRWFEAAHAHPVIPRIAAEAGGDDTWHIAHCIIQAVYTAVFHLLAGGHRDGAGDLHKCRVSLGASSSALGHVASTGPQALSLALVAFTVVSGKASVPSGTATRL